MTDLKRRTLFLTTGKQIRLFGNSMAIGKSLEVGEGSAPNIFSCISEPAIEKVPVEISAKSEDVKKAKAKRVRNITVSVANPNHLTRDEVLEIADFNIRLWMELKDKVRAYGVSDPRIFSSEPIK
jgi:hypothetical protein